MSNLATAEQALEKLLAIKKAKSADTTVPPDHAALYEEAEKALAELKKAKADEDKARAEKEAVEKAEREKASVTPRGISGGGERHFGRTYKDLIQKRAGNDEWLKKFHRWNDDVLIASLIRQQPVERVLKSEMELGLFLESELLKGTSELAKALAASVPGAGGDWIPTVFSPELIDLIRTERVLRGVFPTQPMRTGTEQLSTLTQEMDSFKVAEAAGNNVFTVPSPLVSNLGTGALVLIAVEHAVAAIWSKTFEEDSIIPAISEVRQRVVEGMAKGAENAILHGSTTSPHPLGDSANSSGTLWDDSLHGTAMSPAFSVTSATVDLAAANMTVDSVLKLKLLQGRFGARDADNLFVTSPQGLVKLFSLKDASSAQVLIRADTFGARAVLTTGAVASLFGSDVLVSDLVRTNLNATATGAASNKTALFRFNKKAFVIGEVRRLTMENDVLPLTRQRVLVATERLIMRRVKPGQSSGDRPVSIGVNIETS
jgi:HK97 family phage major capsid protein